MNPQLEKEFDQALMIVLDAHADPEFGLATMAIQPLLAGHGFRGAKERDIERRLAYLADPQIEFVRKCGRGDFHANIKTWCLTARGQNHIRELTGGEP